MFREGEVLIGVDRETALAAKEALGLTNVGGRFDPLLEAIRHQTEPTLVLFYGSLKEGFYNFGRMGKDAQQVIAKDVTVEGYALANLGSFPAAFAKEGSRIVGELHLVQPEAFRDIQSMERGAGYEQVNVHTSAGPAAVMFVFTGTRVEQVQDREIEGGAWTLAHQKGLLPPPKRVSARELRKQEQEQQLRDAAFEQVKVSHQAQYERVAALEKESEELGKRINALYAEREDLSSEIFRAEKAALKVLREAAKEQETVEA